MEEIEFLELKGRKNNLGVSIYNLSFLLSYTKYKVYEKQITSLLRREFKNSLEVSIVKRNEKYFNDFKNIKTVSEVLKAKSILQQIYFLENTTVSKEDILYALMHYIEVEDKEFYLNCLENIFLYKDISKILNRIQLIESALYFIKKNNVIKDIFCLKANRDSSIKILQNRVDFFYKSKELHICKKLKKIARY